MKGLDSMVTKAARVGMRAVLIALALVISTAFAQDSTSTSPSPLVVTDRDGVVGHLQDGRIQTPVNQILTPFGKQLDLPGMRPQALAMSHDGSLLAVTGKTNELVMIDPTAGTVIQSISMPGNGDASAPSIDRASQVSYTGLIFSPDDRQIYLSDVNGSIKVFRVADDRTVKATRSIPLPPANVPRREAEIPGGLALSQDGKMLFVCGNLSNQLLEIELASSKVAGVWPVGVAPYDVVLAGNTAVVSNWGGRRPDQDSTLGPAGRGTTVRVDPVRHIASEGSVSVIDLKSVDSIREIVTGRHASAMALTPDQRFVVCANSADDFLSVIDLKSNKVARSIWTKSSPAELFGATPNGGAVWCHPQRSGLQRQGRSFVCGQRIAERDRRNRF